MRGFTLIEMMIALIVLALLTAAALLSFSGPVERARMVEAVEQVKYLDASSRDLARRFGRNVQIVFDLSDGTIQRRDGRGREASFSTHVASPIRIEAVRTLGERKDYGEISIDVSSLGISQTYALKVTGPQGSRWILVSGLGGESQVLSDDAQVENIFAKVAPPAASPRRDAD